MPATNHYDIIFIHGRGMYGSGHLVSRFHVKHLSGRRGGGVERKPATYAKIDRFRFPYYKAARLGELLTELCSCLNFKSWRFGFPPAAPRKVELVRYSQLQSG